MKDLYPWIVAVIVFLVVISILKSGGDTKKLKERGMYPDAENATMEDIRHLMREGYKIQAIKLYREMYHVGLKEAKEKVEEIQKEL
ncbi:MAG TPA: ribosomal protein L7/L12 [Thermoanaerobaculia bacterium]|nr:ribosomal protein L7/L12 [Thermoanaerobaculia bacterium]HUM29234.1 ribosomal protein L7/L12 [Thermoanaerobaculia bacterium]HXK67807.1 ribosomal protein L7/L12 [Thermoanaerobaculia bacterium]